MDVELRGIAWNHTRGLVPLVATGQRFEELNPGISIRWEKRSLQAFADAPLARLAEEFDLIVMDHPHTALAAEAGLLLPLDDWTPAGFLADQAANTVGRSHASYHYAGRQWTLATDAAAPVATWRADLLAARGVDAPRTWEEVLALAEGGGVGLSLFPVDVLMHTLMFCDALGHAPFAGDEVAPESVLAAALGELRRLAERVSPACLERNPIAAAEAMTRGDEAAYCPFGYGYSNYSRSGYARRALRAGGLVTFGGRPLRSVLGGAGLAISARTRHPAEAASYAAFTAEGATQRGLYFDAGGQPGHRSAWTDARVNAACDGFFADTLPTLDAALVRPQHPRYMEFQDEGSPLAHAAVAGLRPTAAVAAELNALWRRVAGVGS